MSAYIHGSLAIDDRQSVRTPTERKTKVITKTVVRAKALPTGEKLLYLFAVIACCAVLGLIAYRYAAVFEMNSQMIKMETEIRQFEEQNDALRNEMAKLGAPERLIEKGIQLGLLPQGETPAVPVIGANGGTVALNSAE